MLIQKSTGMGTPLLSVFSKGCPKLATISFLHHSNQFLKNSVRKLLRPIEVAIF